MSQHQYYPQLKWKPAEYESLMLLDQTTLSGLLKSGLAFDSFGIAPSFKYVDTFIFPKQLSEHQCVMVSIKLFSTHVLYKNGAFWPNRNRFNAPPTWD